LWTSILVASNCTSENDDWNLETGNLDGVINKSLKLKQLENEY